MAAPPRGPATIRSPRTQALDIGTDPKKFPPDVSPKVQEAVERKPGQPKPKQFTNLRSVGNGLK